MGDFKIFRDVMNEHAENEESTNKTKIKKNTSKRLVSVLRVRRYKHSYWPWEEADNRWFAVLAIANARIDLFRHQVFVKDPKIEWIIESIYEMRQTSLKLNEKSKKRRRRKRRRRQHLIIEIYRELKMLSDISHNKKKMMMIKKRRRNSNNKHLVCILSYACIYIFISSMESIFRASMKTQRLV